MDATQTVPSAGLSVEEIADSDDVLSVYAAPEWSELSQDGKDWVSAIVVETLRRVVERDHPNVLSAILGQRDSYRARAREAEAQVRTLTEQRNKAVEGIKKAMGAPWIAVDILRATLAAIEGERP